jgi:hypothetical protein
VEEAVIDEFEIHPAKIIVRSKSDGIANKPVLVDMDKFDGLIARSNAAFGDASKPVTGPKLPKIEEPKRRRI